VNIYWIAQHKEQWKLGSGRKLSTCAD